ncbi:universal stress protein [Methylobacterium sp. NEAU K]|uniref:universal stress protein n=1 Tax=Methylobacterium sp. NEAU K TaxID=3064946 RepID=UPI002733A884|nr:universal stress protein [Methylobacterium sp. NEAU K]MDP4003317.1 universal stress protein [Methylobacterium sp. NEAU K]
MGYANILVSADLGEAAPGRIRLAADLARRFQATLTGGAAHKVPIPILVSDVYEAVEHMERNAGRIRGLLERARKLFAGCAGHEIRTDWHSDFADSITHLVEQARAADLIVVSRRGPDDEDPGPLGVPPGPVVMEAGRAVLVVPPRVVRLKGARIVVAWRDGAEVRRAVSAALPLIRDADQVYVATVGENAQAEGVEDAAGHLTRHGASVTTHLLRASGRKADEIVSFTARQDADLIVMGAYGHSRLREWMFGGVTRDLLDRSPVCCLVSH